MSTRKERAERARERLTCRGCGVYRAGPHFDPWTKTYICAKQADPRYAQGLREWLARSDMVFHPWIASAIRATLEEIGTTEALDTTDKVRED